MSREFTAAMVVIGNEILSGRTQDKNINYVACKLVEIGVRLREVRIVPDVESEIISTVRELKSKHDYVFTSGMETCDVRYPVFRIAHQAMKGALRSKLLYSICRSCPQPQSFKYVKLEIR